MVGFEKNGSKKSLLFKDLSIILQNSCLKCYRPFNEQDRAPCILYPCLHIYCQYCVENQLLKGNGKGVCLECSKEVAKKDIRRSKIAMKILKIIKQYQSVEADTPDNVQHLQKEVAMKLYNQGFYECPSCSKPYDRLDRLPNIVCENQHLLCAECLNKTHRFNNCIRCENPYLLEFFTNKIAINASEFIHKALFCQTIKIVVNQREFSVVTHSQTSIKDIFHLLQEFDHISNKLQIKLCRFYAEVVQQYSTEKEEVKYEERIGSGRIKRIFLEFDQRALSMGSKVTMASKIIKQLPIKINSFQQRRRPNLEHRRRPTDSDEEDNIFGQKVEVKESGMLKKKQESPKKQKKDSKGQLISQLKGQVSESKLKLVLDSKQFEKMRQEDIDAKYHQEFKKSMVKSVRKGNQALPGTEINPVFVQNVNTKLPLFKRPGVLQQFLERHQINREDQKYLCYDIQKAMNKPFTKQELEVSQKIYKQITQKAKKGDTLSIVMQLIKQELQDGQIKIIFTPKSTVRSQLTLKIITSHILTDRFIIKQKMHEDQEFVFQNMNKDEALFQTFIKRQMQKYVNKFGLNEENIVVHNIVKGSNILLLSTNEGHIISKNIKYNIDRDITLHPYFTQLELSPQDFDAKGYIKFNQQKKDIEFRGNWPYYQPIKSVRYGIKCSGKFDNGNDTWLLMKNAPGQWAVGFHGIRNPNLAYKQCKNVVLNILSGLHIPDKSNLIVAQNSGQAYATQKCINKGQQRVGEGVYLSPLFYQTLPQTAPQRVGQKQYHLVFQCRLQPQEIRIPRSRQNYWVVRNPAAIRPYGIVLIESVDKNTYPTPMVQFGQNFSYDKYRQRIEIAKEKNISNASTSN